MNIGSRRVVQPNDKGLNGLGMWVSWGKEKFFLEPRLAARLGMGGIVWARPQSTGWLAQPESLLLYDRDGALLGSAMQFMAWKTFCGMIAGAERRSAGLEASGADV